MNPQRCVIRQWSGLQLSVHESWKLAVRLAETLRLILAAKPGPGHWAGRGAHSGVSAMSQLERLASEMEYEAAYWQFYGGW